MVRSHVGVNVASPSVEKEKVLSEFQAANLLSWHLQSKLSQYFESRPVAIMTDGYEYWQPNCHVCTLVVSIEGKLLGSGQTVCPELPQLILRGISVDSSYLITYFLTYLLNNYRDTPIRSLHCNQ